MIELEIVLSTAVFKCSLSRSGNRIRANVCFDFCRSDAAVLFDEIAIGACGIRDINDVTLTSTPTCNFSTISQQFTERSNLSGIHIKLSVSRGFPKLLAIRIIVVNDVVRMCLSG